MQHFAQTVFELGQTVPENEAIDPKSYCPGKTAVTNAMKEISTNYHQRFVEDLNQGKLRYGGAVNESKLSVFFLDEALLVVKFEMRVRKTPPRGTAQKCLVASRQVAVRLRIGC